jgi:hypothetical protein
VVPFSAFVVIVLSPDCQCWEDRQNRPIIRGAWLGGGRE